MKQHKTWRDIARAAIQKALQEAEVKGLDSDETKRYVNAAYPFGARAYHPYKIWLSEMKNTFDPTSSHAATADMAKLRAWKEGRPL